MTHFLEWARRGGGPRLWSAMHFLEMIRGTGWQLAATATTEMAARNIFWGGCEVHDGCQTLSPNGTWRHNMMHVSLRNDVRWCLRFLINTNTTGIPAPSLSLPPCRTNIFPFPYFSLCVYEYPRDASATCWLAVSVIENRRNYTTELTKRIVYRAKRTGSTIEIVAVIGS